MISVVLSGTIALVAFAGSGVGQASPVTVPVPAAAPGFRIDRNVAVPMRDGVIPRANILLPDDDQRNAVLVLRTPYDKSKVAPANELTFHRAVDRGYVVVVQHVRGRFASEGVFDPYVNEGKDGYDTIEWAAGQPWSDGRVGTFGLSYPGACPVGPPGRRRILDAPARARHAEPARRRTVVLPLDSQRALPATLTFGDLRGRYGNVSAAALSLSGWYDDAYGSEGAITNFAGLLDARAGQADPRNQLVIGPWTHGVESTRTGSSGERVFGSGAVIDYDALVLDFLDR